MDPEDVRNGRGNEPKPSGQEKDGCIRQLLNSFFCWPLDPLLRRDVIIFLRKKAEISFLRYNCKIIFNTSLLKESCLISCLKSTSLSIIYICQINSEKLIKFKLYTANYVGKNFNASFMSVSLFRPFISRTKCRDFHYSPGNLNYNLLDFRFKKKQSVDRYNEQQNRGVAWCPPQGNDTCISF